MLFTVPSRPTTRPETGPVGDVGGVVPVGPVGVVGVVGPEGLVVGVGPVGRVEPGLVVEVVPTVPLVVVGAIWVANWNGERLPPGVEPEDGAVDGVVELGVVVGELVPGLDGGFVCLGGLAVWVPGDKVVTAARVPPMATRPAATATLARREIRDPSDP